MKYRREIPRIRRARDYRLYDERGNRYLDFFQNGGRALLGHRPGNCFSELKNVLSKGTVFEAPSVYHGRLCRAVGELLPAYPYIRVYEHHLRTVEVARSLGFLRQDEEIPDPLLAGETPAVSLWRPFLGDAFSLPPAVVPVIPFPGRFVPSLLCFADDPGEAVPESEICSPLLLAGLTRIVYDLLAFIRDCNREGWKRFDLPFWKRHGPYLLPVCGSEEEYDAMFMSFLENGILLSPRFPGVSILPAEYTEGEIKILKKWERGNGPWTDC